MLNLFRSVVFILFLNWLPLTQATTNCAEVTQIPVVECEALLDLYNNTVDPIGKIIQVGMRPIHPVIGGE